MKAFAFNKAGRKFFLWIACFLLVSVGSIPSSSADVGVDIRSDGVLIDAHDETPYVAAIADCSDLISLAVAAGASSDIFSPSDARRIAGSSAGTHMIKWWILANAVLAGLGATLAFAHPLTILSAVLASPLTSLNPMIAAGWVAGLVEVFLGKPKVKDFETLSEDIASVKGFWKNKITRILLVVVFTNMGSSLGTLVAIPLMVKVLS